MYPCRLTFQGLMYSPMLKRPVMRPLSAQRWDMEPEVPSRRLVNHYQGQCLATETDAPPGKLEVGTAFNCS
jgi:hypothetical protein